MASTVQMNYTDALSWINEIEELNQQLDASNQGVTNSIQEIQSSSSGSVVDSICTVLNELTEDGVKVINAFDHLVGTVTEAIKATGEAAEKISELVSKVATLGLI